jgi:hypothetical protein
MVPVVMVIGGITVIAVEALLKHLPIVLALAVMLCPVETAITVVVQAPLPFAVAVPICVFPA